MSPLLKTYLNQKVIVITVDGTLVVGTLIGYDKLVNLTILTDDKQLHIYRGSEIVCCGLLDDSSDTLQLQKQIGQFGDLPDTRNKIQNEHLIWAKVGTLKVTKPNRHKRFKKSN